ncbi:MAG: CrcB family protein [Jatrophihabitantaceae bacterium]
MSRPDAAVLSVVSLGGGLGSLARYGLGRAWPDAAHQLPYTTLAINLTGSLLLGMLVVAVTEIWRPHRLVRPLLGTGILGGYTTFSTFAVQARALPVGWLLGYLALSVLGGLLAAAGGMSLMRKAEPRLTLAGTHELVDPTDPELP